jgi:hypothetical protein
MEVKVLLDPIEARTEINKYAVNAVLDLPKFLNRAF